MKAWEIWNEIPEQERFELVVINPSFILGPSLIKTDFLSGQVIRKILSGKFPGMPKVMLSLVDIRDTALAHLRAITVPEAAN